MTTSSPARSEPVEAAPHAAPALGARVMGIVNVTPDSFSDGGTHLRLESALAGARRMVAEGAHIIDVGGESTRPGAEPVPLEEELARVVPVVRAIRAELDVLVSIDTTKPQVMRAAVEAGAGMINDVMALREPGALAAARDLAVPVCLMHMQGQPRTMQANPRYGDVVREVREFLLERVDACLAAGIDSAHLVIDPGFGFGKTVEHNLALLAHLDELAATGYPVLAGLSRKSMIGRILGRPVEQRAAASAALALLAVQKGASIVRVHDVAQTVDVLVLAAAVASAGAAGTGAA